MKKVLHCDLHVHTNYSYDNPKHNTMEHNIAVAIERGIDTLCFTDHIEISNYDTFSTFPFEKRQNELDSLRQKYGDKIKLLLGFEMGSPHHHPKELDFLRSLNPDMIIGSVHYPTYYHNIHHKMTFVQYEELYNQEVRKMVEFGGFEMLGHADMPKKYHQGQVCHPEYLCQTLELCAKKGIVPELNTSAMRLSPNHSVLTDTMPNLDVIKRYATAGGKYVAINSDSHSAETLGWEWQNTYQKIKNFLTLCYFEKGKLVEIK